MKRTLIAAVLTLALPAASHGEDAAGQRKQVDKLAAEFKVEAKDVQALRDQGLGWGEVRHALDISRSAKVPVADVMKLRKDGMGWGQIADKYGTKVGGPRPERFDAPRGGGDKGFSRGAGHGRGATKGGRN
jgi:hypothetical protein